jgi:hypothetical protein
LKKVYPQANFVWCLVPDIVNPAAHCISSSAFEHPDEVIRGVASAEEIINKDETSKAIRQRIKQNQERWCVSFTN